MCRAYHHNKNNFIETIPNKEYINEIGSIKWWKEYLDKDLEIFDINKKYPPGSLLLRKSFPRHAALVCRNIETNSKYNPKFVSIIHVVETGENKILDRDGLYETHFGYQNYLGQNYRTPFEYVCHPNKWLQ